MLSDFLEICGAISIVGGAVAIIWKAVAPQIKKGQDIQKNAEAIAKLQQHKSNDLESIKMIRKMEREQCCVMLAMLNHMIDGNGVEDMKKTRKELEKLITDMDN